MFKNIFKKEKPLVEFWTSVPGLSEVPECVPKPAKHFVPQWLKNMPAFNHHDSSLKTIKHCPVIPEFLTQGYILPMWCDTILRVGNSDQDWGWNTATNQFKWEIHADDQFIDHVPAHEKNNIIFKSVCPWYIKTSPGYSIYQMPLHYHFNKDFTVLPGSLRTDMYHEINQQVVVKHNSEIFIPRGTPLVWYIPYKRETYELSVTEETDEKRRDLEKSRLSVLTKFTGGYKTLAKYFDQQRQD